MTTYAEELANEKNYKGNVVVRFLGNYFALRQPDSGLVIDSAYEGLLTGVVGNRVTSDPRRISTSIASYTLNMIDREGVISAIVKDDGAGVIGQEVEIWVGRTDVSMPFSEYKKLPTTQFKSTSRQSGVYSLNTTEDADRINRPLYDLNSRLAGDILFNSTDFVCKDSIVDFPASGYLKLDDEFCFYASKDDGTKTFSGIARGVLGTTAVVHSEDVECFIAEQAEDNPLNIILKLLISNGGGGTYDTLVDGIGIDESLIDVAGIEDLRDRVFPDVTYRLGLYNISNALTFIEKELLEPNNLRITNSRDSLLTLAVLNSSAFVDSLDVMTHDSIIKPPKVDINGDKIVNQISVQWGFDDATGDFAERSDYSDADSIAAYGKKTPLTYSFKGVRSDLDGQALVDDFANGLLDRLSTPTPEITFTTTIDKSLLNVGDKTFLRTTHVPNSNGRLRFAEELEILERAIDFPKGTVDFKLAFTTYTGLRPGYIAPASLIATVTAQDEVDLASGQGDFWQVGFKVRLWNNLTKVYESDATNEISSVDGDTLQFVTPWSTTLTTDHKIKFAGYAEATDEEKRFCFVSLNSGDFSADERQYKIIA